MGSLSTRRSVCLAAFAVMALVGALVLATPHDARAVTLGTVSGVVRGVETSGAVQGAEVALHRWVGDEWGYWEQVATATAQTDAAGAYSISVAPGIYRVSARGPFDSYAMEYFSFSGDAYTIDGGSEIVVTEGANVTGVDFMLSWSGYICGTLTAEGGAPLAGFTVIAELVDYVDEFGTVWTAASYWAYTDESGMYSLSGLPAGQYRVQFQDPEAGGIPAYISEYYINADRIENATDVSVTPSMTVYGIDAALTPCSTIAGRVTAGGSTPVEGVLVEFEAFDPGTGEWWWHGSAETAADGTYSYGGLRSGTYRVRFNGGGWVPAYLEEYYNDAADAMSATDVVVGTGVTVANVDADLAPAGRITGVVTGDGQPLSAVTVPDEYVDPGLMVYANVYRWNIEWLGWESVKSALVDPATGAYDAGGLPTGTYRVRFEGDGIGFFPFVPECYSDVAFVEDAQDIAVTAGAATSGIDADLALGGTVSGTVSGPSGAVSDVWVDVYRQIGTGSEWESYCGTLNSADGSYTVYGLPAGTYRIGFQHQFGEYAREFWGGTRTIDGATDVVVSAGSSVTGIDAQLDPAGSISGNVTSGGGTIFDTELVVEAHRWNATTSEWEWAGETFTCDYYTIGGLAAGTYRVRVYAMGGQYVDTYYGGTDSIETATDVNVVEGSVTSGIDIDMPIGGRITGMVVGATGATIAEDLEVVAYRWTGSTWSPEAWAGPFLDEYYTLGGLPAGRYKVVFRDWRGVHATEYYDDAVDLGDAVEFNLALGQTISGVNAQLGLAGYITGTVTGPASEPYENITVTAWRWDSGLLEWDALGETITAADGTYAIDGLPSGAYHVYFDDWTGESQGPRGREFYNDIVVPFESGVASSTDVIVVQGSTTPNIDAQLGSVATTDSVAPVTTAFLTETGWTSNDVTLELSATDADSGVGATYYAVDGGAPQLYVMPIVFQNEGVSSIDYWSVDSASNAEASRSVTVSIDRSAPITTSDAQASYQGGATVTLNATDAISGVSETLWSLDGAAPSSGTTITTSEIGTHTIDYLSMDFAGNIESTRTVMFQVVLGGPCGSSAEIVPATPDGLSGWYRTQPSVYVTATPPGGFVGAPTSFIRIDSGAWTTATAPVSISAGAHVISYYSVAGVSPSQVATMSVKVDYVRPSRPVTPTVSSVSPTGFKLSWPAVTDEHSGVSRYDVTIRGAVPTQTVQLAADTTWVTFDHLPAASDYIVTIIAVDHAGNNGLSTQVYQSTPALVGGTDIPAGSPVVTLPGGGTLDFDDVITPGAVYVTPIDPRTEASDENFRIVHGAYFDIHVEAEFSGEVILTLPYDETQLTGWQSGNATQREAIERSLKLKHRKADGGWEDITVSVDTVANTITGRTTSFSDFWIEEPVGSGNWVLVSGSTALTPIGATIVVAVFAFVVTRRRRLMAA